MNFLKMKKNHTKNTKTLVFDFDGTIIDTARIKGLSFKELFSEYDKNFQDKVYKYHLENLSLEREEKLRYYCSILGIQINKKILNTLSNRFSEIVCTRIDKAEMIIGFNNFIDKVKNKYKFYIVSNAPTIDIKNYLRKIELYNEFAGIYGTPLSKRENFIRNVLNTTVPSEVVYFGDTLEDYKISKKLGIHFIGIDTNKIFRGTNIIYHNDFTTIDLCNILT